SVPAAFKILVLAVRRLEHKAQTGVGAQSGVISKRFFGINFRILNSEIGIEVRGYDIPSADRDIKIVLAKIVSGRSGQDHTSPSLVIVMVVIGAERGRNSPSYVVF